MNPLSHVWERARVRADASTTHRDITRQALDDTDG